jgi:hypothetical protein
MHAAVDAGVRAMLIAEWRTAVARGWYTEHGLLALRRRLLYSGGRVGLPLHLSGDGGQRNHQTDVDTVAYAGLVAGQRADGAANLLHGFGAFLGKVRIKASPSCVEHAARPLSLLLAVRYLLSGTCDGRLCHRDVTCGAERWRIHPNVAGRSVCVSAGQTAKLVPQ